MKKSFFMFLLLGLLLFSNIFSYGISQNSKLPENIRIGLFFEATGRQSTIISGENLTLINNSNGNMTISNLPNSIEVRPFRGTISTTGKSHFNFSDAYIESEFINMVSQEKSFVYYKNGIYYVASVGLNTNIDFSSQSNENAIFVLSRDGNVLAGYSELESIKISSSNGKINIHSNDYRGSVSFRIGSNNTLTVINIIDLEEYLYGVVPNEMPASWNLEALKAQAIAARNYAVKNLNKFSRLGFDLCSTTSSQVYRGISSEHRNSTIAVNETRGKLLYHNNEVAEVFYHSSSGGRTENPENIWSSRVPHIVGVDDPYSLGSPHDNWTVEFTKDEIEKLLLDKRVSIGKFKDIEVVSVSENNRITKVVIKGSEGNHVLEKEAIRFFFGLKSNYFTLENHRLASSNFKSKLTNKDYSPESLFNDLNRVLQGVYDKISDDFLEEDSIGKITFNGKGWGHGIGMSQYGAKKMGDLGYSYQEILQHYFKNVYIK